MFCQFKLIIICILKMSIIVNTNGVVIAKTSSHFNFDEVHPENGKSMQNLMIFLLRLDVKLDGALSQPSASQLNRFDTEWRNKVTAITNKFIKNRMCF